VCYLEIVDFVSFGFFNILLTYVGTLVPFTELVLEHLAK